MSGYKSLFLSSSCLDVQRAFGLVNTNQSFPPCQLLWLLFVLRIRLVIMLSVLSLLVLAHTAVAATVTYNWDITWVNANPDGAMMRPVIGINGQWPCPSINANVGDRVMVHVTNKLGNETTSLHWHGLFQQGSDTMDGPSGVTQCEIPPGSKFTYDFKVSASRSNEPCIPLRSHTD